MVYAFDQYTVDTERFELAGPEGPIEAEPQALEFLIYLIKHRGTLVTKDAVHEAFWPNRVVSDAALSSLVRSARRLVGDSGSTQRVIETRHGRGFRFRADVVELDPLRHEGSEPPERTTPHTPHVEGAPAIAVLPFDVMGGSTDARTLTESITEEVISALSRSRWFPLISRNRVRAFLELPGEARNPLIEMGAAYLVEGGVIREDNNVRLHLQLTDTTTGRHIHAARHDLKYSGLFALLDQVSTLVTATVHPELGEAERMKAAAANPSTRSAWEEFLLGQQLIAAPDHESNKAARAHFERAIALEPQSGRIRAGIAMTHLWDYKYDWSDDAEFSLAAAARDAERALRLAPDDSWALAILAICKLTLRRFDDALADVRRAIKTDPSSAMAEGCLSWVLGYSGHYEEALDAYERAMALSPNDRRRSLWLTGRGIAQFGLEDFEGSLDAAHELIALSPDHPSGHRMKCASLARLGRLEEAQEAARHLLQLLPHHDVDDVIARQPFRTELGDVYAAALKRAGLKGTMDGATTAVPSPSSRFAGEVVPVNFATSGDGVRIAWAKTGEGPPLFAAVRWYGHIGPDIDSPIWGETLAALSQTHSVIRADHRGMGRSDRGIGRFTLSELADDMEAVVDAAGANRFDVVAMAQACPVTLEFIRRHPGRVSRAVLYGSFAKGWRDLSWGRTADRIEAIATMARLEWEGDEPAFRRIFTSGVFPDADAKTLAWLDDYISCTISGRNASLMLEALADFDLSEALGTVDAQTLLLHARKDVSVPIALGRTVASAIQGARFYEVDSHNHILSQTDTTWGDTLQRITEFLRTGNG